MSNRKKARDAVKFQRENAPAAPLQMADGFQNFIAHLGHGTGNQADGGNYGFRPVTRNRMQMEWVYRGSWVCGVAVDCVADDMTREGAEVTSDADPGQIKEFDDEIERLQIWQSFGASLKWGRLYGGSISYLMIDGQNPATPLRTETIQKGQFKGIMSLDRWLLNPTLDKLIGEYGPNIGLPMYYNTVPGAGLPPTKIHHSRVIRHGGVPLPYWQKQAENLWDQSVLERMWDRLIAFDSTTTGIAQLVYKAHLRVIKIEGLRDIIAMGGPAEAGLAKNLEMIRALQNTEGLTVLDSKDEFQPHAYSFAGLDDVLTQFGKQISGALQIPLTRLFGESPGGLGSDGSGEDRHYYDGIKQKQVRELGPGTRTVYELVWRSKFGADVPKQFGVSFKDLWQLSDMETAQVAATKTDAVLKAADQMVISRATALKELKAISKTTGVFASIEDAEIKQAESDPTPSPEALGIALPVKPDPVGGPAAKGKGKAKN